MSDRSILWRRLDRAGHEAARLHAATNALPIRRLGLAAGQAAEVRAAWLRFPSFALEPLEQVYRRTGDATYRYESAGGRFVADLEVNAAGLVIHYPGFCQAEAGG